MTNWNEIKAILPVLWPEKGINTPSWSLNKDKSFSVASITDAMVDLSQNSRK